MPRLSTPNPNDEISLHDSLTEVKFRLEDLGAKEPAAKLGINECNSGLRLWEKELKVLYERLRTGEPTVTVNVADLDRDVAKRSAILERALAAEGKSDEVKKAHQEHKGHLAIAEALLKVAQTESKRIIEVASADLKDAVSALTKAQKRVQESGHSIFDAATTQTITRCWIHLDNAYDFLGICCPSLTGIGTHKREIPV